MLQKIKNKLIIAASVLSLLAPVGLSASAYAATANTVNDDITKSLKCGSNVELTDPTQTCDTTSTANGDSLETKVKNIINVFSAIVGVVSVIMIIYGGFRYVTSGGKQESVTNAKNTILYALIGLVIVALSQAIVHFVLNKTTA